MRCAASDREHHQRGDEEDPDHAHRDPDGERGEDGDGGVEQRHGAPATRLPSSSSTAATSPRYRIAIAVSENVAERDDDPEVVPRHGEDRAEEELEQPDVEAAGARDEHHPERDSGVEDERERLVARGAAPGTKPFDREGAHDGEQERRQDRRDAEQVARRDARERNVSQAVAHERLPPLDEEEAHGRGQDPDDRADGEREAHELELEHQWTCEGSCQRAGSSAGSPSNAMRPRTSTSRVTTCSTAPNSCETYRIVTPSSALSSASRVARDSCELDVDARRRLVERQQRRLGGERAGDERPLLHAARERPQRVVRALREPDPPDCATDGNPIVGAQRADRPANREPPRLDHLAHGDRRAGVELRPLAHVPDPRSPPVARGDTEEADATGRGSFEAENQAQERRLAAAVRSGDADERAGLDRQGDVVQDRWAAAVGEGDPRDLDGGPRAGCWPTSVVRHDRRAYQVMRINLV